MRPGPRTEEHLAAVMQDQENIFRYLVALV
jgi:hypothetical protein